MSTKSSGIGGNKKILSIALVVVGLLLAFNRPLMSFISPAKLELKIQQAPVIMPSIYKVYANESALEGKYSLFKMLVTNTSSSTARNVEVSYQVTNYKDWTTIEKIPFILPGQSVVVNCYPEFPDKIVEKTTSSKETVSIRLKGNNMSDIEQSFPIDCKGRNEFMYTFLPADEIRTAGEYFDNNDLLACLVTPEDPIIKYYTQKIQEKILKGETASVTNSEQEGVRFLMGIYNATYLSHMVYSGTTGVPAKLDDVSSIVQSIRLPREVVTGKTGLCIELSLLYASIMASAGMDPIVFLIPGHAYPGFRMNGKYYAIESTGIGGEGIGGRATAEQALQTGMKNLKDFFDQAAAGDSRYMMVDIRDAIKRGAVAMELKDDQFLRQKIDEIAQSFDGGYVPQNTQYQQNQGYDQANNDNNDGGNNGGGTPSGYNLYQGVITFAYPGAWKIYGRNANSMPQVKHLIANSSNTAYVEVYQFSGYSDPTQALSAIRQFVGQYGATLRYQSAGQTNSGYSIYSGQTSYNGGGINWMAAFKPTGNGVVGIAAGANMSTGTKYQSTVTTILNSLR
ncbi:MAG: hypothetical protein JSU05_06165 [Bacteroidetes bacterium]|nr:hypothetical protein [Bacteroidota bacterium]